MRGKAIRREIAAGILAVKKPSGGATTNIVRREKGKSCLVCDPA